MIDPGSRMVCEGCGKFGGFVPNSEGNVRAFAQVSGWMIRSGQAYRLRNDLCPDCAAALSIARDLSREKIENLSFALLDRHTGNGSLCKCPCADGVSFRMFQRALTLQKKGIAK